MATFSVPARNDLPWYNFTIILTGAVYTLTIRYNPRMDRWIMNIADSSGNDLVVGLPLLIGRNINGRFVALSLPPGIFVAQDNTNQDTQPTRYSFGIDHTLFYADGT